MIKNKQLMDLQLFAEENNANQDNGSANSTEGVEDNGTENNGTQNQELTEEQIQQLLQSDLFKQHIEKEKQREADRVRTEYSKKLKEKMTEEERKQAELEEKEREIEELRQFKIKYDATEILKENELPLEFVDLILSTDADKMREKAKILKEKFDEGIQKAVEDRRKASGREAPQHKTKDEDFTNPIEQAFRKGLFGK